LRGAANGSVGLEPVARKEILKSIETALIERSRT
jgi:hypothetical protein